MWGFALLASLAGPHIPTQLAVALAAVPVMLVPGYAVVSWAGIDRRLTPAATLAAIPAAGLAAWGPFAAIGFAAGLPFVVVAATTLTASGLAFGSSRRVRLPAPAETCGVIAGGVAVAVLGSRWQAMLMGDGLFHAGVIRKILGVGRLSLRAVWQFRDGHPHPGYAFPLLHVVEAATAWVSGTDPSTAFAGMTPMFAFLVPVAAYAVGRVVAGPAAGAATAVLSTWTAMTGVAYLSYMQQPRYVVTFVALPLFLALLIEAAFHPDRVLGASMVVLVLLVGILHLTYAVPLLIMLALVSLVFPHLRVIVLGSAAACAALAAWVYAVAILGGQRLGPQPVSAINFVVVGGHRVALSGFDLLHGHPEYVVAAVLAAALVRPARTPIGILALCTLAMTVVTSLPGPTLLASTIIGPGQALRYGEEVPWVYMLGPGLVVLCRRPRLAFVVLGASSIVMVRTGSLTGGRATEISLALGVIAAAGVGVALASRHRTAERALGRASWAWVAVLTIALLAGPLWTSGKAVTREAVHGKPSGYLTNEPTPGAVGFLRAHDAGLPVVLAPYQAGSGCWYTGIAYELVGEATVYAVAVSSFHTEASPLDQPVQRRAAVDRFLAVATPTAARNAILRRYRVSYVALDLKQSPPALVRELTRDPVLKQVYRDPPTSDEYARFVIFATRHGT